MQRARAHVEGWLDAVATVPGAETRRADGVIWCVSDIGWPMFNGAAAGPDADPEALRGALAELRANDRPWFFFELADTPEGHRPLVAEAGASRFDDRAPWMEARRAELAGPAAPDGVEVEEAADEASWRRWAAALRAIYEFPPAGEESWLEPARRLGWRDVPWRAWTASREGRAVGCTLLIEAGGVAALFGVGVAPEERGRGIGRLMTLLPLAHAEEEWAGFWSTPLGNPLYASLGFATDGWVTRWLGNFAGPPPDAARG